jgi:hypothetical protein
MATSGSSFKPKNPSSSQFNGHLEKIEQQKLNRKPFFLVRRLGDIWIHVNKKGKHVVHSFIGQRLIIKLE